MSAADSQAGPGFCTVTAPTGLKALRLLREQLGPEAFILSSTLTAGGVQVVGSLEAPAAPKVMAAPTAEANTPLLLPLPVTATGAQALSEDGSVLREIHSMRSMIEEQLAGLAWNQTQRRDPLRGQLLRTLLGSGLSARLARELLADLPAGLNHSDGLDYLKSAMAVRLPVLQDEDALMDEGGVYALTGPTGVGKTTTTAKLAARCVMRFGAAKLALITTDNYRIGAHEQLRIYGEILGVGVHAVRDAEELETVLARLQDKHMVLIDTVGMSQRDCAVPGQIAMLSGASRPVRRLLLLNAASHGDTLNEVVKAYHHGGLAGCIITKVDEATHPGAVMDIVIRHQLPVHYVCSGQKVPENLVLADRGALLDSVLTAPSQSSWFVAGELDADMPAPAPPISAKVAAAEALSRRLRAQCQQLIRTLAHNAQELTFQAAALAAAEIGFESGRALARLLAGDPAEVSGLAPAAELAALPAAPPLARLIHTWADDDSQRHCSDLVLACHGEASPAARATLLLSDSTGLPFAAFAQHSPFKAQGTPESTVPALRQLGHKPVVHLWDGLASFDRVRDWQSSGLGWMASAPAGLAVALDRKGNGEGQHMTATLEELLPGLDFSTPEPLSFRGRSGLLSVAEMVVNVVTDDSAPVVSVGLTAAFLQRCVVRRIVDAASGRLVEHRYLLASLSVQAPAQQLVRWADWQTGVRPYFRLLEQSLPLLETGDGPHAVARHDRLQALAHHCLTAWRLQQTRHSWAEPARRLLAQLAGQALDADVPVPAGVLLEGLGKLHVLLDALETDTGEAGASPATSHRANVASQGGRWKS